MTDGVWITPQGALDRQGEGSMPMVFPTIKTLQALAPYLTPSDVIKSFRKEEIGEILPTLVKTATGVGIKLP